MINSTRNKSHGAATLILTVMLMVMSSLIIIFAANFSVMRSKTVDNIHRNRQAFHAAEAGLEYGINYLKQNSATVLAGPVNGYISYTNASITNVTLANNSKFSIVYSNPIANNYSLIRITSTGTNDDGTSTRVVIQDVAQGSLLLSPPNFPLVTKGQVSMSGSAQVINTTSATTIESASSVSLSGSSKTVVNGDTSSTSGNIQSDVQQDLSNLSNLSQSDFFSTYFGSTTSNVQNNVAHYYSNNSSTNYSDALSNMTGTSIWIDQTAGTATISGATTIGTADNPVLLIVNGNLSLSGNVTIYGFVFVIGTNDITSLTGNVNIIGGIGTTDTLNMAGSIQLTYDSSVISNLQQQSSLLYYAKVPGSWRDF